MVGLLGPSACGPTDLEDLEHLSPLGETESLTLSAKACSAAYDPNFLGVLGSSYPGYTSVIDITSPEHNVRAHLAYSPEWKAAILAFRGTVISGEAAWANVEADLDSTLVSLWGGNPARSYYRGFWDSYSSVRNQVNDGVREAHAAMGGVDNFVVTGHSLGASLAMLGKMDVGNTLNGLAGTTHVETNLIALPNSGNQTFIDWQSSGTIRYVYHQADLLAGLFGDIVTANSTFPSDERYWRPLPGLPFGSWPHGIDNYISSIRTVYGTPDLHSGGIW